MKNDKLKQKLNLYTVIVANPKLPDGAKTVAGALLFLFHNTKTGQCFPENATVGIAVGMHHKTVSKHIGELVKAGYLLRDRRFNKSSITGFNWAKSTEVKAVRERIKAARDGAKTLPYDGAKQGGVWSDSEGSMERYRGVHGSDIATLTLESKTRIENRKGTLYEQRECPPSFGQSKEGNDTNYSKHKEVSNSVEESDTDTVVESANQSPTTDIDGNGSHGNHNDPTSDTSPFAHFWSLYPYQYDYRAARREFLDAVKAGTHLEAIIEGLRRFIAHREAMGPPHRWPYPANWLRAKGWATKYPTSATTDNPYAEEDAKYPPCPAGMRADVWRGLNRVYGDKLN
jgi:Helix-turn-helix domain